ncbi:MAG: ATP-binding protein [Desulfobacteraceae bacterium]|nr:ATP-binding protein [Desulfobacteraceae bacterium]
MNYFQDSLQHLFAELERIDLLIAGQVAYARRVYTDDDQFRGLYIPEEEVDALLHQPIGLPRWARKQAGLSDRSSTSEKISRQIDLRKQESLRRGIELRLHRLQQLFGLDQFEIDAVLICLAVELDLRYERLYAYLQDDVTRKRPSVDLVLSLLAPSTEAKFTERAHFSVNASLFRNHLLELVEDPSQPHSPLLAKFLKVNSRMVQFLLNIDEMDDHIQPFAMVYDPREHPGALIVDDDVKHRLGHFVQNSTTAGGVIVHLRGPYGVGRQNTAEAECRKQGCGLLVVDLEQLTCDGDSSCAKTFCLIQREAKLQQAAVYWKSFDTLLDQRNKELFRGFIRHLQDRPGLTFLAGEMLWEPSDKVRGVPFARIELPIPGFPERSQIWSASLNNCRHVDPDEEIAALGSKFKFTGGRILDAVATAENLTRLRNSEITVPSLEDLYEACRLHSNQKLATLARKITPRYKWKDIVLPADRLEQLREICNHVKYRERVYGEWGFGAKLSLGKGLNVLFAGPSGTGKTMAAEIIAGELGLELYKIDLATVVSKYIGETEKNLSQIFTEAETSNAILFFDEADALFGKRSEVKDSHDRYANIETGYLLQRMEEYEGVVILATNLRKNMDEAFVRRLHFTVEFPFPNEADRLRIWEGIWPEDTPRDLALDLCLMAQRFELSGGNIKNIALSSAFFAANDGSAVNMSHLLRATKRECQKIGKIVGKGEFEQHSLTGAKVTQEKS